ncbi:hypothetical protein D1BOALGB6SA_8626 [Olavius sp. associated proteobacterium Delta 1]|nr:hypothetical protein D1BOALGB6SA_8626 [Olavius sp. associated proteobacterium Delta 1]
MPLSFGAVTRNQIERLFTRIAPIYFIFPPVAELCISISAHLPVTNRSA